MKKLIASAVLLMITTTAFASCPPYAPYGCRTQANGKMLCGCGIR